MSAGFLQEFGLWCKALGLMECRRDLQDRPELIVFGLGKKGAHWWQGTEGTLRSNVLGKLTAALTPPTLSTAYTLAGKCGCTAQELAKHPVQSKHFLLNLILNQA